MAQAKHCYSLPFEDELVRAKIAIMLGSRSTGLKTHHDYLLVSSLEVPQYGQHQHLNKRVSYGMDVLFMNVSLGLLRIRPTLDAVYIGFVGIGFVGIGFGVQGLKLLV